MKNFKLRDYKDKISYTKCDIDREQFSPTELIQLYCVYCCGMGSQKDSYRCANVNCLFQDINNKFIGKPHELSEEKQEQLRKQLEINRAKRYER